MTDAPERIFVKPWPNGAVGDCWHDATTEPEGPWEFNEYTRSDLTQAAVAAALEEAVRTNEDIRAEITESAYIHMRSSMRGARGQLITEWDCIESHLIEEFASRIRNLIPTIGTEALERIKEQVREQCIEQARKEIYTRLGDTLVADQVAAAIRGDIHD